MAPIESLKKTISDTGEVNSAFGGFEISVSKPNQFSWDMLINELIKIGQRVRVEEKEGKSLSLKNRGFSSGR